MRFSLVYQAGIIRNGNGDGKGLEDPHPVIKYQRPKPESETALSSLYTSLGNHQLQEQASTVDL